MKHTLAYAHIFSKLGGEEAALNWQRIAAIVAAKYPIQWGNVKPFIPKISHGASLQHYIDDHSKTCRGLSSVPPAIHSPLSPSSRGSLVPPCFLPLEWCHLHIWDCWYFSLKSWFQLEIHPAQYFARCTLQIS